MKWVANERVKGSAERLVYMRALLQPLPFTKIAICCIAWLAFSCSPQPPVDKPVKILFDTDMGSDCDDVGALALLHTFADRGQAEILACSYSSGKVPYGAGVIDAINRYYKRPEIPIGADWETDFGDPVDKMGAELLAKDTARFGHRIVHNRDAEEQVALARRILAAQPDHSVTYITIGHTKALYQLLQSVPDVHSPLSGQELVAQKVAKWVALGALGAANPEGHWRKDWNFFFNETAPYTQWLVAHFPRPIVYVDAGNQVMTGKSLAQTPTGNIVRQAYENWLRRYEQKTLDDQRPSWDLATVYYAVCGTGGFLRDLGTGSLDFDSEKGCRWKEKPGTTQQNFVVQQPGTDAAFADYLNTLLAIGPR